MKVKLISAAILGKALICATGVLMSLSAMAAWEPERPVELVVPTRAGSDLDQRARLIQDIITKYQLMKQPLKLVYKSGGAGAEGFLAVKNSQDAHQLLIADNNLLSVPLFTGASVNWKDMTPVAMLALEQFVLWTNSKSGYKSAKEYIEAVKVAGPYKFKMGGAGSGAMPDHILTYTMGWGTDSAFKYVPLKSTEVAGQLVAQGVDSTVNNPIEALDPWRSGTLTAQCVFDDTRMPYTTKITARQSWNDIPTCKEVGIPVDYQNLLGIFMPPQVGPEQVSYYIKVLRKMAVTPEWKNYMEHGAFKQLFKTDTDFIDWLSGAETFHQAHAKRREMRFPK